jgi:hypothetical protein
MNPGPGESGGRRAYERPIDPSIEIYVQEQVSATRHLLRNEFTEAHLSLSNQVAAMRADLAAAALQNAEEHAEVNAGLRVLRSDLVGLKAMRSDVEALKSEDLADQRAATAVRELRRWMLGLAGLIVAAATAIGAFAGH